MLCVSRSACEIISKRSARATRSAGAYPAVGVEPAGRGRFAAEASIALPGQVAAAREGGAQDASASTRRTLSASECRDELPTRKHSKSRDAAPSLSSGLRATEATRVWSSGHFDKPTRIRVSCRASFARPSFRRSRASADAVMSRTNSVLLPKKRIQPLRCALNRASRTRNWPTYLYRNAHDRSTSAVSSGCAGSMRSCRDCTIESISGSKTSRRSRASACQSCNGDLRDANVNVRVAASRRNIVFSR